MDIVAIGELLIDFGEVGTDSEGYPTLQAQPGGAPANLLVTAARFGCSTAMVAKVGDDVFGRLLIASLAARGVDTSAIAIDSAVFTTLAFVTLDAEGERSFSFARKPGADTRLCAADLPRELLEATRLLHFGSLGFTDEPARTATMEAVALAKESGALIGFDPNWRPALWPDETRAREAMTWGFSHADIVKLSIEDAAFYWRLPPDEALDAASRLPEEFGCDLVFCTLGAQGCRVATPTCAIEIAPPVKVTPVDTTGAGDVFTGAALAGLLACGDDPAALTCEDLTTIATSACEAASLSTLHRGGFPPL